MTTSIQTTCKKKAKKGSLLAQMLLQLLQRLAASNRAVFPRAPARAGTALVYIIQALQQRLQVAVDDVEIVAQGGDAGLHLLRQRGERAGDLDVLQLDLVARLVEESRLVRGCAAVRMG
jgi:hypothetical protein